MIPATPHATRKFCALIKAVRVFRNHHVPLVLFYSLIVIGGDDDLALEIITYERKSAGPANCADLNQYLMDGGFSATTGQIVVPLLWDS